MIEKPGFDPVNHPKHYTSHPSGIECIQVTEHMSFCIGNAVKYLWRADLKEDAVQDLEKAKWYIEREIEKRKAAEIDDVKVKWAARQEIGRANATQESVCDD